MTDERKKDLGFKLTKLVEELQSIAKETNSCMSIYAQGYDTLNGISVYIHYGDGEDGRMVMVDEIEALKDLFFIERDDTVRKENENGEENAEK